MFKNDFVSVYLTDDMICPLDEFVCNNLQCVPYFLVCNGVDDCGDGTDEQNCNGFIRNRTFGMEHCVQAGKMIYLQ